MQNLDAMAGTTGYLERERGASPDSLCRRGEGDRTI